MKQLLVITSLLALSFTKSFAHATVTAKEFGSVHSSGTYFKKSTSASWSNINTNTSFKASYAEFNGENFTTLIAYDKETEVVLECKTKVSKGELCLIIENSNNEIIFKKTFAEDEAILTTITLEVYEEYKIRFAGNATSGAYSCKWTPKKQ